MTSTFVNAAGKQFVRDHLKHIPQPYEQASIAMREWLQEQGHDFDPDQTDVVTLRYFGNQAVIDQRLSLTQALLSDWQGESEVLVGIFTGHWVGRFPQGPLTLVDRLPDIGAINGALTFSTFNGLFRRTTPPRYDSTTLLSVDVEAMQKYISHLNFHTLFVSQLDAYWQQGTNTHAQSLQISYLAACNKQVEEGSLSDAGRQMAWQAAGIMDKVDDLQVRPLNVYGYAATDLIYIKRPAQPQVLLYLPGNASPFHEFDTLSAMKDWFAQQCRDSAKRQRLLQYFKMSDAPDGFNFSGLETALHGLAAYPQRYERGYESGFTYDGYWPAGEYVNYKSDHYSPALEGDLFTAITARQRKHSYDDAHFSITTNAQVSKARWRGYLVTTLNLVAPLALVVPELIPLLAVGGIAQLGLGIDQIVNGKTAQDKSDGGENVLFGLLNAAPLTVLAADRVQTFFTGNSLEFVAPHRVNDQIGYPLSPVGASRLPQLDEAVAGAFSPNVPVALPEDSYLADHITRFLDSKGINQMTAVIEEKPVDIVYDSEHDAFMVKPVAGSHAAPTYYRVENPEDGWVAIDAPSPATDEMRMRTLRALGVDLQLPIKIPPLETSKLANLPKKIFSIWIGDNPIPSDQLETLRSNVQKLSTSDSKFTYQVYLSNKNPAAYAAQQEQLRGFPPPLKVETLEDQIWYNEVEQPHFFDHYSKALDNKHYAMASNVLRYPILNQEGGFYMDIDDTLLTDTTSNDNIALIAKHNIRAPEEGLVLKRPVNFEPLNLHCDYANTPIGSHANNDVLTQISDLMRDRYLENEELYDTLPPQKTDPGFKEYALKTNTMDGPRLLNDVIKNADKLADNSLYRLYIGQQLKKLEVLPQKSPIFLLRDSLSDAIGIEAQEWALDQFIKVGNLHSWIQP
ncbi:glycosyltransferase [Pseudomonas entomophila]|uniref:dermonecrotic toxin domain-containing protein n=1 Tax=Pseudomonas entomophila TaxID=312306 RepID=UPI002405D7A1|nr:DUF6543 domain-containing protein [Pseudomonas entomophila]MDF9616585.1 glycosyltransferase [Pseudomonas entomophila]